MLITFALITLLGPVPVDTSIHLPHNGSVEIHSQNRDVVVRVGASDVVTVHGGSADLDGGTVAVSDRHGRYGSDDGDGTIDVTVPADARVEINALSGDVHVTGGTDRMEIQTINGSITATNAGGTAEFTSVSGMVTVRGFHGAHLSVNATNDDIVIADATGIIEANNVSGAVKLTNVRSSSVTANTINDDVSFAGDLLPGGNYSFASQNGDVTLLVPANLSARLRFSTMNGEFNTAIPGTTTGASARGTDDNGGKAKVKAHDGEHTMVMLYGSGSANVDVEAFNGDLNVKARP